MLLATTGLRLGEALGLKWEDIDFAAGKLVVRRALRREMGIGFVLSEPKTPKSRRRLYLAPAVVKALNEHWLRQDEERVRAHDVWQAEHDQVFKSEVGKPMQDGQVSWTFHQALTKANLTAPDPRPSP